MIKKLITIILAFSIVLTGNAAADGGLTKFNCGNVPVELYNGNISESPFFVLTVHSYGHTNYHAFEVTKEFLRVRCEQDKTGDEFLLVSHICGGSACVESNYYIIKLSSGEKVLQPSERQQGNAGQASTIFGKPITPFACKQYFRGAATPNAMGEVCVVSPIELG